MDTLPFFATERESVILDTLSPSKGPGQGHVTDQEHGASCTNLRSHGKIKAGLRTEKHPLAIGTLRRNERAHFFVPRRWCRSCITCASCVQQACIMCASSVHHGVHHRVPAIPSVTRDFGHEKCSGVHHGVHQVCIIRASCVQQACSYILSSLYTATKFVEYKDLLRN